MVVAFEPADPAYIAYIDEAGDPGLSKVWPIDPSGSTEWFILGAFVIRLENERMLVDAVRSIRSEIRSRQGPALHYRTLTADRKAVVCQRLATLPARCFVLLSNKKNMRSHRNDRVEAARGTSTQSWFYNFCVRVLLERITTFVEQHSLQTYGKVRHLKVVFSERGGLRYSQTNEYIELLRNQARSDTTFLTARQVRWSVLNPSLFGSIAHVKSAGAQLADVIASSFFQATNISGQGVWDPSQAKLLRPRVWSQGGKFENHGVSLLPWRYHQAKLTENQKMIFRFYGFDL